MDNLGKFCFRIWRAAKTKNESEFRYHMSRNAKLLGNLKEATPKQISMILYGIRIFPIKNESWWNLLLKNFEEQPDKLLYKGSFLQLSILLLQKNKPADQFWNRYEDFSQPWIKDLSLKELTMVCTSYAQNWKSKGRAANDNVFWVNAETIIRGSTRELDVNNLSKFIWAFGKVKYQRREFWDLMTRSWISNDKKFSRKEIILVYLGYAKIYKFYQNKDALSKLEANIINLIPQLSKSDFLTVLYSMALTKSNNREALSAIQSRIYAHAEKAPVDYLVISAYCLAKLKVDDPKFYSFFVEKLLKHIVQYEKFVKMRDLANSAWVIARVFSDNQKVSHSNDFWKVIESKVLAADMEKIATETLTMLIWSFYKVKKGSAILWKTLSEGILLHVHQLDHEQMSIVLNAFTFIMVYDDHFWRILEERTHKLLKEKDLTHFYLSKLLRSFAKPNLPYKVSDEFRSFVVQRFLELCEKQVNLTPNDLFDYVLAFSTLEIYNPDIWSKLYQVFQALEKRLPNDKMRNHIKVTLDKYQIKEQKPKTTIWTKGTQKKLNEI